MLFQPEAKKNVISTRSKETLFQPEAKKTLFQPKAKKTVMSTSVFLRFLKGFRGGALGCQQHFPFCV